MITRTRSGVTVTHKYAGSPIEFHFPAATIAAIKRHEEQDAMHARLDLVQRLTASLREVTWNGDRPRLALVAEAEAYLAEQNGDAMKAGAIAQTYGFGGCTPEYIAVVLRRLAAHVGSDGAHLYREGLDLAERLNPTITPSTWDGKHGEPCPCPICTGAQS